MFNLEFELVDFGQSLSMRQCPLQTTMRAVSRNGHILLMDANFQFSHRLSSPPHGSQIEGVWNCGYVALVNVQSGVTSKFGHGCVGGTSSAGAGVGGL